MSTELTIKTFDNGKKVPLKLIKNNFPSQNDEFLEKWKDKHVNIIAVKVLESVKNAPRKQLAYIMSALGFIPESDMVAVIQVDEKNPKDVIKRLLETNPHNTVLYDETNTFEALLPTSYFAIKTDKEFVKNLNSIPFSTNFYRNSPDEYPVYTGPYELVNKELVKSVWEAEIKNTLISELQIMEEENILTVIRRFNSDNTDSYTRKMEEASILSLGMLENKFADITTVISQTIEALKFDLDDDKPTWFSNQEDRIEAVRTIQEIIYSGNTNKCIFEKPQEVKNLQKEVKKFATDANSVVKIWKTALMKTPLILNFGFTSVEELDTELLAEIAHTCGIDFMLENYFDGVPLEDII